MDDSSDRPSVLRVEEEDDVASALRDLAPGEIVRLGDLRVEVRMPIPRGHKLALHKIAAGTTVVKFGSSIGFATEDIDAGCHIHSHNLATGLSAGQSSLPSAIVNPGHTPPRDCRFMGYRRENGTVGTRNEIWVLCTVGCVSRIACRIADAARPVLPPGIDGIYAFPHPFGCSQLGGDLDQTRRLLVGLACNPNAGGVLIVGLGCENNQLDTLLNDIPTQHRSRVRAFAAQAVADELQTGVEAVLELAALASDDIRTSTPLGDLVLGLKCGGSDGMSGLTANPLVGDIASWLDDAGGTPVLTEVPELFGAEQFLFARARAMDVAEKAQRLVDDFKAYFIEHGEPIYENPSPGNKAGGLTTLEEKSLGAVQKAGRSRLAQIVRYGERITGKGFALLEAPGNDAVSSTALAAAGASLILFTTGRGTPMGFPVPTLKIASNSQLAERKPHWIDFDAGCLLEGVSRQAAADLLLTKILAVASGASVQSERNGEREIAIWKRGVTV